MAHQTGIEPSDELKSLISKALRGSIRFFEVKIINEQLVPGKSSGPKGSWEEDLDDMVPPILEEDTPCYIFYRLDSQNCHEAFHWIFMSYTPDLAPVKLKMLYAATKATMRKAFESSMVVDDIAATTKDELTLAGYRKHEEASKAPPPLTDAELELKMLNETKNSAEVGTGTRQSHIHGIAFPIQPGAMDAIEQFRMSQLTYLQLSIDVKKEVINLERTGDKVNANDLSSLVPNDAPRYHLFRFCHSYEGDYQEAVVFIYSSPGFKTSVKERMLYSSCKEPLVSSLEEQLGTSIAKKIEIDSGDELNEDFIMDEVHPKKAIYKPKFLKPKGPARRPKSPSKTQGNGNGD